MSRRLASLPLLLVAVAGCEPPFEPTASSE